MSHPVPGHDYAERTLGDQYPRPSKKKREMAKKMPYLGDSSPRKGEPLSKSIKRFARYLNSGFGAPFDVKASYKSAKRHRRKEGLPF